MKNTEKKQEGYPYNQLGEKIENRMMCVYASPEMMEREEGKKKKERVRRWLLVALPVCIVVLIIVFLGIYMKR